MVARWVAPRGFGRQGRAVMRLAGSFVVASLLLASCVPCVTNVPDAQAPYAAAYPLSTTHAPAADPAVAEGSE